MEKLCKIQEPILDLTDAIQDNFSFEEYMVRKSVQIETTQSVTSLVSKTNPREDDGLMRQKEQNN